MSDRILNLRELNRATLSRQMLLERKTVSVCASIERLVGLQAQAASAPYIGLWTRLRDFRREDLARSIEDRSVIKATFIRGTLHLVTADDYVRYRATLQPMLTAGWAAIVKQRNASFGMDKLLAAGRDFIGVKPRTFADISAMLSGYLPDQDIGAMRYAVRTHLPLVQVPVKNGWSYPGNPQFALAEPWIGKPISHEIQLQELVKRYLAAFGPASATDMQTWSGLNLRETVERLKPDLVVYRDERRRELFDLPDSQLLDADVPAPVRFLPEYDNLLLSHSKRTRVIADEHRPKVYLPGLRVAATVLVDGFVSGRWKIEKTKGSASLMIEPFDSFTKKDRGALAEEGEGLVRFVEPGAKAFDLRFVETMSA